MSESYTSKNIKALRESRGLTQPELAEMVGVSVTTVWQWEHGQPIRKNNAETMCSVFNVTEQDLFGFNDGLYAKLYGLSNMAQAKPSNSVAPLIGNIAAGDAREVYEYPDDWIWIPPEILERDPDVFYLKVSGDSMNETEYTDETYAAISPNTEVHNGDIAAVKVNGDEATLKVYKNFEGVIHLEPKSTNPEHKRRVIDSTDPDAPYVRVLGKAIWSYRKPKF